MPIPSRHLNIAEDDVYVGPVQEPERLDPVRRLDGLHVQNGNQTPEGATYRLVIVHDEEDGNADSAVWRRRYYLLNR